MIHPLNNLARLAPLALAIFVLGSCQPVTEALPTQEPTEVLESTAPPIVQTTATQASNQSGLDLPVIPQTTGSPDSVRAVDDLPRFAPTSFSIAIEHLAAMLGVYPEDILIAKTVPTDANFSTDGCVQIDKLGDQTQAQSSGLLLFLEGNGGLYRYHVTPAQILFCGQVE